MDFERLQRMAVGEEVGMEVKGSDGPSTYTYGEAQIEMLGYQQGRVMMHSASPRRTVMNLKALPADYVPGVASRAQKRD